MQESEAEVVQHLQRVDCPPLQLGLPWIMTAFAGHLAVGEVLLLWDRIIAFDSLLLLPVLGVAVLAFRRQVRSATQPSCYACCCVILLLGTPLLTLAGHGCYTPSPCLFTAVAFLQVLLAAESKEQVLSIMEDLSQLKVVPLLQGVLFGQ